MKPILFSTEMVQAILAGRKTQTRRVVKAPVLSNAKTPDSISIDGNKFVFRWNGPETIGGFDIKPLYNVGDVLWVRETWRVGAWDDEGSICVDYKADGFTRREWIRISDPDLYEELWQQSSDDARKANASIDDDGNYYWDPGKSPTRWRLPVTMPREAARLFLRVKDVRVERVQDIGAYDSYAEGYHETEPIEHRPRSWFSSIWDARNAKRGYGWDSNPWVWVIEFEKCNPE